MVLGALGCDGQAVDPTDAGAGMDGGALVGDDASTDDAGGTDAGPPDPTCPGCLDGTTCVPGDQVDACGSGGLACTGCDDGNPCTSDVCVAGACENRPDDVATCDGGSCHDGACCTGCWDGAACQAGDALAACGAAGGACATCSDDGDPCTEAVCDAGACASAPTSAICSGGVCVGGSCCTGCVDGASCLAGDSDTACGAGGAMCESCDDANDCTIERCGPSGCLGGRVADGTACGGGRCHGGVCCTGCWTGSTCMTGPAVLETQQLTCTRVEFLSTVTGTLGQSFRVPRDGMLAGIEIRAHGVNGVEDMTLTLYEETGGGLSPVLATSTARAGNTATCLSATSTGGGYFETGCLAVQASRTYRFVLSSAERCRTCSTGSSFRCCGGDSMGLRCSGDFECVWRVSRAGNVYSGGTMYRDGVAASGDLAFKVFMMP